GESRSKGLNPPKLYTAVYVPPTPGSVTDILGEPPMAPQQPSATVTLPPGITAEDWDALPQPAKEALAKVHNLPAY
ncbi:MAG TPA: hypothetical protein VGQ26_28175, partial [Streptosporangiaceae bacterium]|nr:hypothetical protein [Streptosporangiaceae bacterium]